MNSLLPASPGWAPLTIPPRDYHACAPTRARAHVHCTHTLNPRVLAERRERDGEVLLGGDPGPQAQMVLLETEYGNM